MNVYHYKCYNCLVEFISENMLYCPFCGSSLRQQGLAEHTPRDYVVAGWNAMAFRGKPGFVVKNTQARD